jgi:hypothetical protein
MRVTARSAFFQERARSTGWKCLYEQVKKHNLLGKQRKGGSSMHDVFTMLEKVLPILTGLLLIFVSCPAMALDSGLSSDQATMVIIGVIIIAILIALIGFERLIGGILILGAVAVSLFLTVLFFPFSLFLAVPFAFGGCFWSFHHWHRPVYRSSRTSSSSYSASTVYSPNASSTNVTQEHHHHYAAPERKVVYVPLPYERQASLPPSSKARPLPRQQQCKPNSYDKASLVYDDDDED